MTPLVAYMTHSTHTIVVIKTAVVHHDCVQRAIIELAFAPHLLPVRVPPDVSPLLLSQTATAVPVTGGTAKIITWKYNAWK